MHKIDLNCITYALVHPSIPDGEIVVSDIKTDDAGKHYVVIYASINPLPDVEKDQHISVAIKALNHYKQNQTVSRRQYFESI